MHTKSRQASCGFNLTNEELAILKDKAKLDKDSAWRISLYYSFSLHDFNQAENWNDKAAELGHCAALRSQAFNIKRGKKSFSEFGGTPQDAVRSLYQKAFKESGSACYELAECYEEGYFGNPNFTKAKKYFTMGAELGNRMCWMRLAEYLYKGKGGEKDILEAYYWMSLEAGCVHPNSIGGRKTWDFRNEIVSNIDKQELKKIWVRVDEYIFAVRSGKTKVSWAPFLEGMIKAENSKEGKVLADQKEHTHRKRLMNPNNASEATSEPATSADSTSPQG